MPRKPLISIIDDDDSFREALTSLMNSLKLAVEAFPSAADFLSSAHVGDAACLIADVNMPGLTGIELHSHLVERGHIIPTILITAFPDATVRARALADGVVCYLTKPCDVEDLLRCVRVALDRPMQE